MAEEGENEVDRIIMSEQDIDEKKFSEKEVEELVRKALDQQAPEPAAESAEEMPSWKKVLYGVFSVIGIIGAGLLVWKGTEALCAMPEEEEEQAGYPPQLTPVPAVPAAPAALA